MIDEFILESMKNVSRIYEILIGRQLEKKNNLREKK